MTGAALLDTGPIVAILARDDEHHERCVEALKQLPSTLLTCWPVLTEAAWLLRSRPAAIQTMLRCVTDGIYRLAALDEADAAEVAVIMSRYRSAGVQLADATLVHLADRENMNTIFTLDRRDFSIYRTRRGRALTIVPT